MSLLLAGFGGFIVGAVASLTVFCLLAVCSEPESQE